MDIRCTVGSTRTYQLTLTASEGKVMSEMMRLIDPHNLALQVACQLTNVIGAADLSVDDMVEPLTEELSKYGQMILMIRDLSRLGNM